MSEKAIMSAAHTAGPWHTDSSKSFYVFADGALAEQAGVEHGPFVANCSTQANARLIAACPEMFEALSKIARMLPYGDGDDETQPDGEDAMRVLNWHIEQARKLIAKATGG